MIRILIIDDVVLFTDMMKYTLEQEKDFEVVGVDVDAKNSLSLCKELNPDVVLMDVCTFNNSDGIYYGGLIKKELPNVKIIAMTSVPELSFVAGAKDNRFDGFIYKNVGKDTLISAIRNVVDDYQIFPNSKSNTLPETPISSLTAKEKEILTLFCKRFGRNEVADMLDISISTVRNYVCSILSKTGYDNIRTLAMYCIANHYIMVNLDK